MTDSIPITDALSALITTYLPEQTDKYAEAYNLQTVMDALFLLHQTYEDKRAETVCAIRESGAVSEFYRLEPVVLKSYRVNVARAREGLPADVYADVVHIRGSDAAKILGRVRIYEAVRDYAGDEVCKRLERINRSDLLGRLPYDAAAEYLEEVVTVADADRIVCVNPAETEDCYE